MKWIRWDGDDGFDYRAKPPVSSGEGGYDDFWEARNVVCEKDRNWREIESGALNMEDGKLHITLKPVPKAMSVKEAWDNYKNAHPHIVARQRGESTEWRALVEALDREASQPANPYTKEAVEELLDAVAERNSNGTVFEIGWLFESKCELLEKGSLRLYDAFHALKKQREAANA